MAYQSLGADRLTVKAGRDNRISPLFEVPDHLLVFERLNRAMQFRHAGCVIRLSYWPDSIGMKESA